MRVSEHFGLGLEKGSLEFLDVDIYADTACFVHPAHFTGSSPIGDVAACSRSRATSMRSSIPSGAETIGLLGDC